MSMKNIFQKYLHKNDNFNTLFRKWVHIVTFSFVVLMENFHSVLQNWSIMPPPRGASFEWNYHSIQSSTTLPTYYLLGTVSLPPHAHKCALNDKTTVVSERNRLIMSTYSHSPTSEKAKFWAFMVRSASHAFCSRNEGKCCIMMIARLHPAMISNINYLFIFRGNATAKQ